MKEHLRKRLQSLDGQLFDLNAETKKVDKEHEEVGQNLYNEQQRVRSFKTQITKLTTEEEETKKVKHVQMNKLQSSLLIWRLPGSHCGSIFAGVRLVASSHFAVSFHFLL